jgi:Per1-like family
VFWHQHSRHVVAIPALNQEASRYVVALTVAANAHASTCGGRLASCPSLTGSFAEARICRQYVVVFSVAVNALLLLLRVLDFPATDDSWRLACRQYVVAFIAAVNAALLLEVLDFPAIGGLVDAHALWHAATVPLTGLWYSFMVQDVAYMAGAVKGL